MVRLWKIIIRVMILPLCLMLLASTVSGQIRNGSNDSVLRKEYKQMHPVGIVIKTNILPILWGTVPYTAEYRLLGEFMVGRGQTLSIGASYLGKSLLLLASENSSQMQNQPVLSVSGYRVQGAYKFYFIRKNLRPEGPYVALHSSWSSARIYEKGFPADYLKGTHFNVNFLFGAQLIAGNMVAFDIFLGPGYKDNNWSEHRPGVSKNIDLNDFGRLYSGHLKFTLGFNVGVAF